MPWAPDYEPDLPAVIAASNRSFDADPRTAAEIDGYERSQAIKKEQAFKRRLTAQMNTPGIDADAKEALRKRRANANGRLINLNKAQRAQYKGWR